MKHRWAAMLTAIVLSLAFVVPVAARASFTEAEPEVALNNAGKCVTKDTQNVRSFVGSRNGGPGQPGRSGVSGRLYIAPGGGWAKCVETGPVGYNWGSVSTWVAITPSGGTCSVQCILQIGTYTERRPEYGDPYVFWAAGGCNGYDAIGQVTLLKHPVGTFRYYTMYLDADGYWNLQFDHKTVTRIHVSNPRINCWSAGQHGPGDANWLTERQDMGDSIGYSATQAYSTFNEPKFGLLHQGWFNVDWPANGNCNVLDPLHPDDKCVYFGTDYMKLWTTN